MPGFICGIAGASSFMFATAASVVKIIDATLAAFCRADLVTFVGSTIPAFFMSTYSDLYASKPMPASLVFTCSTITEPSRPAFSAICLNGSSSALRIILAPVFSSPSNLSTTFATASIESIRTVPPPATIPSSTAALVAARASSILSFLSLSSTSVAAPTWITATPPESFASLSCNFSLSNSESDSSI